MQSKGTRRGCPVRSGRRRHLARSGETSGLSLGHRMGTWLRRTARASATPSRPFADECRGLMGATGSPLKRLGWYLKSTPRLVHSSTCWGDVQPRWRRKVTPRVRSPGGGGGRNPADLLTKDLFAADDGGDVGSHRDANRVLANRRCRLGLLARPRSLVRTRAQATSCDKAAGLLRG